MTSGPEDDLEALSIEHKQSNIVYNTCEAHSGEEHLRPALQLCVSVHSVPPSCDPYVQSTRDTGFDEEREPAITALRKLFQRLLSSSNQSAQLVAISALTALLRAETEVIHARGRRGTNAVRLLFSTPVANILTTKAASALASTLEDVESPLSAYTVDHVLKNVINIIGSRFLARSSFSPLLSVDRARASMVITEYVSVDKALKFVLRHQERLRHVFWDVVWDLQSSVQEQGVRGLHEILKTIVLCSESRTSRRVMTEVFETIHSTLTQSDYDHFAKEFIDLSNGVEPGSNSAKLDDLEPVGDELRSNYLNVFQDECILHPKSHFSSRSALIHGLFCMLGLLTNSSETLPYMHSLSAELCSFFLRIQTHNDTPLRRTISEILPHIVLWDRLVMSNEFLDKVHSSTMQLLNSESIPADERGRSLISLATIRKQVGSNSHAYMLKDIFAVCKTVLYSSPRVTDISDEAVVVTISHLAEASQWNPFFERTLRDGLLMRIIDNNFPALLVQPVDYMRLAMPSLDTFIREGIVNLFTATLEKGLREKRTGRPFASTSSLVETPSRSSTETARQCIQRIKSTSSFQRSARNGSLPAIQSSMSSVDLDKELIISSDGSKFFFEQHMFSDEVHRTDSSSSLSPRTDLPVLESLTDTKSKMFSGSCDIRGLFSTVNDLLREKQNPPFVALKAIMNYDFKGMRCLDLTSFTIEYVIGYLESNSIKMRVLSVGASAKLMELAIKEWLTTKRANGPSERLQPEVEGILAQLALVAVEDPSKDVRYVAIRSIDRVAFRPYLLQREVLSILFMCFHDESIGVRDSAVSLVGRLSRFDPAYILPALKPYLGHLLISLRMDGQYFSQKRREAAQLIYTLVHNTQCFVGPYINVVMDALLLHLEEVRNTQDTDAALPILLTVAEMGGTISHLNLKPYHEALFSLIVSSVLEFQGVDILFWRAVLRALAALVQNTGFVIKPYAGYPSLLPRLLEALRLETDPEVRIEVEKVLGALGAVDPNVFKYAALPILSQGSRFQLYGRAPLRNVHGPSFLKTESPITRSIHWAGPFTRCSQSGPLSLFLSRFGSVCLRHVGVESRMVSGKNDSNESDDILSGLSSGKLHNLKPSLSWFSLGGVRLQKCIFNYTPDWARNEIKYVSLVGQLDHPFSQSEDYIPSVLLDELHKLMARQPLHHLREVCQAIVDVLKSTGSRCAYFLPEVVPRMILLIDQESVNKNASRSLGLNLKQYAIQSLCDIVSTSGKSFIPYAFDTILLVWDDMRRTGNSPQTMVAFCSLLTKIRFAIGAEFKPVIATILPLLLEGLVEDETSHEAVACAILSTLESFCPLFQEYNGIVLHSLTKMLSLERSHTFQIQVLASLVRIIRSMDFVIVMSSVIHALVPLLAGVSFDERVHSKDNQEPYHSELQFKQRDGEPLKCDMTGFAALALFEIGSRSSEEFDVYVPLITEVLISSPIKRTDIQVYTMLKNLLLHRCRRAVLELLGNDYDSEVSNISDISSMTSTTMAKLDVTNNIVPRRTGGSTDFQRSSPFSCAVVGHVHIVEETLVQKWEVEHHFKAEDWVKWIAELGAAMLQQSGCAAVRACVLVSELYPTFTQNLFNPAFLSCWTSPISDRTKSKICSALHTALSSPTIPLTVLQALLNLFEFMDHDEKPLPVEVSKLAATAYKCGAHAKALRYREQVYGQFIGKPEKMFLELSGDDSLISIYEKLDHIESAVGTIAHYEKQSGESVQEQWYEKLQRWDDALVVHENSMAACKNDSDIFCDKQKWGATLGRLRCLNQIGEWRQMIEFLHEARDACNGNSAALKQLASEGKALSVSFDLGLWEELEDWLQYIRPESFDGCFYNSLLLIKRGKENPLLLDEAESNVQKASQLLDLELTARVSEGYPRAYMHIVQSQTLVELKEMINFLRMSGDGFSSDGKRRLQDTWDKRLSGCKRDRSTWHRILMTRGMVLNPIENKFQWLEYATMCRKAKLLPMAGEVLSRLVSSYVESCHANNFRTDQAPKFSNANLVDFNLEDVNCVLSINDADLKIACIKHLWALNRCKDAFEGLESYCNDFMSETVYPDRTSGAFSANGKCIHAGKVFLKLSKWGHRLRDSGSDSTGDTDPLEYARLATEAQPNWCKAWHDWAVMNCARFESMIDEKMASVTLETNQTHINYGRLIGKSEKLCLTNAVKGYFKAINLSGKFKLEDSLKLLTLWFCYGGYADMHHDFNEGFLTTNITRWLEVVPQIIARLHTPFSVVQRGVKLLLTRIGKAHPHVAVYPLTVAKGTGKSHHEPRSRAAQEILDELKRDHEDVVCEAEKVARELDRVAVLWTEMWLEKLEEASRLCVVERHFDGMIDILLPLQDQVEHAETAFEMKFVNEFGSELHVAAQLCRKYRSERSRGASDDELERLITAAWDVYTKIYSKIQRHNLGTRKLHLSHVSHLGEASGLTLAVPGTYDPSEGAKVIGIEYFNQSLEIMPSKQRPRKLSIIGNDGNEYQFLLKGREDLRQDERVMQVFGLINKLFAKSGQQRLLNGITLKTYSVVALSANAGLIEWVPDCDTILALVTSFRNARKIAPNIEQQIMVRCAPDPNRLNLTEKVRLFEYILQCTSGADLSRIIWLKSRNSEMWLDRRTTYAKSLAITSMVGYILGLGDRHPSNLMIERSTGKIIHIDFGDCFEAAMKREDYPEKVPFRLTRMMINALEPCGVEGYFRHTAIAAMEVLRQKNTKESLMSIMEAFVYDPLICWKLLSAEELTELKEEREGAALHRGSMLISKKVSRPPTRSTLGSDSERGVNQLDSSRPTDNETEDIQVSSSLSGLSRNVSQDICEIVRSLSQTGSLTASLRRPEVLQMQRREASEALISEAPGAVVKPRSPSSETAWLPDVNESNEYIVSPSYEARMRQAEIRRTGHWSDEKITHVTNEKAQLALNRISDKLCGTDYDPNMTLTIPEQIDRLILDARNIENLCTLFMGWCAFW